MSPHHRSAPSPRTHLQRGRCWLVAGRGGGERMSVHSILSSRNMNCKRNDNGGAGGAGEIGGGGGGPPADTIAAAPPPLLWRGYRRHRRERRRDRRRRRKQRRRRLLCSLSPHATPPHPPPHPSLLPVSAARSAAAVAYVHTTYGGYNVSSGLRVCRQTQGLSTATQAPRPPPSRSCAVRGTVRKPMSFISQSGGTGSILG